jgi:uncharacterized delta-60 repeat protein
MVTLGFLPDGSGSDVLTHMTLDNAGRILLLGSLFNGLNGTDFALARLLPNGQPDANFDADGRVLIGFDLGASNADEAHGLAIQRDGRIVLIGIAETPSSGADIAVARLLPDGTLDAGFGIGGRTLVPFDLGAGNEDFGFTATEERSGHLLFAGTSVTSSETLAGVVAKLTPDGVLDFSFGTLGKRTYFLGLSATDSQAFLDFAWQDSRLLIRGTASVEPLPTGVDTFVVRLETDRLFADGFE